MKFGKKLGTALLAAILMASSAAPAMIFAEETAGNSTDAVSEENPAGDKEQNSDDEKNEPAGKDAEKPVGDNTEKTEENNMDEGQTADSDTSVKQSPALKRAKALAENAGESVGENVYARYDEDTKTVFITGNGTLDKGLFRKFKNINDAEVIDFSGVEGQIKLKNNDAESLFANLTNLKSIVDLGKLDTTEVESMAGMFSGCSSIENIDLSGLETDNLKYMCKYKYGSNPDTTGMFNDCNSLKNINFDGFDASKVINMTGLFSGCSSLPEGFNFNQLNTDNVEEMFGIFRSLTMKNIDISQWTLPKLKTGSSMFARCSNLKSVKFNKNTIEVNRFGRAFYGCTNLEDIDISSISMRQGTYESKISSYAYLGEVFYNNINLKRIKVGPGWIQLPKKNQYPDRYTYFPVTMYKIDGVSAENLYKDTADGGPEVFTTQNQIPDGAGEYVVRKNIIFDSNAGEDKVEGQMSNELIYYSINRALFKNEFKRDGYIFAGWGLNKDDNVVNFKDGQEVSFMDLSDKTEPVTLYAKWIPAVDISVNVLWKNSFGSSINSPLEKVEVELYKNGNPTGIKLTLGKENNWKGIFENLPKSEEPGGVDIVYTVKEIIKDKAVDDNSDINIDGKSYKVSYSGNMTEGFTITNNELQPMIPLEPALRNIKVTEVWKDDNDAKHKRPKELKVELLEDGKFNKEMTLDASNNWTGEFRELKVSERIDSPIYQYTVKQADIPYYDSVIEGNMTEGFTITNTLKKEKDKDKDKDKDKGNNTVTEGNDSEVIDINKGNTGNLLNTKDHYAYLFGYKDWSFRPDGDMTRAEAAAMFSRLMINYPVVDSYSVNYSDVKKGDWYYEAIAFLNHEGILKGYPDGTFRPDSKITRAEFAAIASRFENLAEGNMSFSDVSKDFWAYRAINSAASKGWVKGYPDGTFKPENNITRAEVTTMTNNMLNREADRNYVDSHEKELVIYNDVKGHWSYYEIEEATNGHDYSRKGSTEEIWEKLNHKAFLFSVEGRNSYFSKAE